MKTLLVAAALGALGGCLIVAAATAIAIAADTSARAHRRA